MTNDAMTNELPVGKTLTATLSVFDVVNMGWIGKYLCTHLRALEAVIRASDEADAPGSVQRNLSVNPDFYKHATSLVSMSLRRGSLALADASESMSEEEVVQECSDQSVRLLRYLADELCANGHQAGANSLSSKDELADTEERRAERLAPGEAE